LALAVDLRGVHYDVGGVAKAVIDLSEGSVARCADELCCAVAAPPTGVKDVLPIGCGQWGIAVETIR
jgi:hypothetical protein